MFGLLARLLEFLYRIWPSYGGAIVLFTLVIMLILAPLTFKSVRSMLAMQALQPEMKKLQNRYKDDRQKLNEEMMRFYRENKISPLGGCLPMLIQMPVFFILYEVLYKLTLRGPFGADLGHSVACHIGGTNTCVDKVFTQAGYFHPAYLDPASKLYQSLSQTRVMQSFGLDLAQSAWSSLSQGIAHALPFLIMVLVVIGLTYFQQQQIQSRQPKKTEQNPTQQMMMKVMPVAMGFIYIIIPAGVVVYFLVSSAFRIAQQGMVTRTFYTGPNAIVLPSDDAEDGDDTSSERKGFWSQFKPPEESLPRVGKNAKKGAVPTTGREQASPKKSPDTKGGKSNPSKTSKKTGGTKSSASKSGSKSASKSSSGGSENRAGSSSAGVAPGGRDASVAAEKSPEVSGGPAPSRKAPSRKAPENPGRK